MVGPSEWHYRQLRKEAVRAENRAIKEKRLKDLKKRISDGKKKGATS